MGKGKSYSPQKSLQSNIFESLFESISKFLPHLIRSPLLLLNFALKCLNQATQVTLFIILVGQTVHILHSDQKRYINIRHILIKWLIYIILLMLVHHVKHHTIFDQLFILLCNSFAFAMVYPSKLLKDLHLKYFSYNERKKYDEELEDPSLLDLTLITKIAISLSITFLNISRFLITFIPLNQRKKIEEALKQVNLTIVEQKYFGKIYDPKWNKNHDALNHFSESQAVPGLDNLSKQNTSKSFRSSKSNKPQKQKSDNTIKMRVQEHIQIILGTILSSDTGHRKFAFYRNIEISYNVESTELMVTSEDDNRSITHTLSEIVIVDELMLQFIFEDDQDPMFVRFKTKREKQLFINYIYLES